MTSLRRSSRPTTPVSISSTPKKLLQEVLLGLHSMCKGADAQFFNGHTNITSSRFLVFGVKGMLSAAKNVRNAMLFNVLSFMSDKLPDRGQYRGSSGRAVYLAVQPHRHRVHPKLSEACAKEGIGDAVGQSESGGLRPGGRP